MLTKSLVAAAAALAATTALSLPADAAPNNQIRGTVIFWLLDRNGDGAIDKSEVEALRTVIFDAVDTNGDGKVTRDEFMAVIPDRGGPPEMRGDGPRHGKWEQRGDRRGGPHGPGYAEGRGPGPRHGEWQGQGRDDGPRGDQFAEGRGPGPRHGERQGHGAHDGPGDRMMARLGIDAEDGLSKSDFVAATPKLFERADADGNGTVSQSEFEQASRHIGRLIILE